MALEDGAEVVLIHFDTFIPPHAMVWLRTLNNKKRQANGKKENRKRM
jgi:hypothetical protein